MTRAVTRSGAHESGSFVHAEDGAQDDLEGEAPQLGMDRKRPTDGPAVDHPIGDVAHDRAVGLDALAVERRLHHAAFT
jgi:hypothetical protein